MKVETATLMTVKNYSLKTKVTTSYIYKLIKEKKMAAVEIDGVQFIDIVKYPTLVTK